MAQVVVCSGCQMSFAAPPHLAGQAVPCPSCGTSILIPSLSTSPLSGALPAHPQPIPQQAPVKPVAATDNSSQRILWIAGGVAGGVVLLLVLTLAVSAFQGEEPNAAVSAPPSPANTATTTPVADPTTTPATAPPVATVPVIAPSGNIAVNPEAVAGATANVDPLLRPEVPYVIDPAVTSDERPIPITDIDYLTVEQVLLSQRGEPRVLVRGRLNEPLSPEVLKNYPYEYRPSPPLANAAPMAAQVYNRTTGKFRQRILLNPDSTQLAARQVDHCFFHEDLVLAWSHEHELTIRQYNEAGKTLNVLRIYPARGSSTLLYLGSDPVGSIWMNVAGEFKRFEFRDSQKPTPPASYPPPPRTLYGTPYFTPNWKYGFQPASATPKVDSKLWGYLRAIDVATGKTALFLRLPEGRDSPDDSQPLGLTFRNDGQAVAAYFESNNQVEVAVWSLPDGKLTRSMIVPVNLIPPHSLHWVSPEFLALKGETDTFLLEPRSGRLVWRYKFVGLGPEGWAWHAEGGEGKRFRVTPVRIPSDQVLARIRGGSLNTDPNAFLTGDPIHVEVGNVPPDAPADFSKSAQTALQQLTTASGYVVKEGEGRKVRIHFQKKQAADDLAFDRLTALIDREVKIKNEKLALIVEFVTPEGKVVWKDSVEKSFSDVAGGKLAPKTTLEALLWERLYQEIVRQIAFRKLPPFVASSTEARHRGPAVGSSTFVGDVETIHAP